MLEHHDAEVLETFRRILGPCTLDAGQYAQIALCTGRGGIGLVPQLRIAPAAFLGSWCACKLRVQQITRKIVVEETEMAGALDDIDTAYPEMPCLEHIMEAHAELSERAAHSGHPDVLPPLNVLESAPLKAQRAFSKIIHGSHERLLFDLSAPSVRDMARIRSTSGFMASAWMHALPSIALFRIENEEMTVALRLRLGLPIPRLAGSYLCQCQAPLDPFGHHSLTCRNGYHRSLRHDRIASTIRDMLRALSHVARDTGLDGYLPLSASGAKLVLDVYGSGGGPHAASVGIDVAVTHPCAASYVAAAAREALGCAALREGFKVGKYRPACSTVGIQFVPAVFETFGSCGAQFEAWFSSQVDWMSERVGDRDALGGFTAATFSSWWQQRISVALQLGNARCIIERARRDQPQGGVMEGHDDSQLAPCEVQ
jgi:hypothetical protein